MSAQNNFNHLPNLSSLILGAQVVYATDEWFAEGENLLKGEEPVWDETKFTVYGKWMDGWESRRKRTEGYDWCIIKLNIPGEVHSFEVDTCHFTGNYSPMVSIQACYMSEEMESTKKLLSLRKADRDSREDGRMGLCATAEENALVADLDSENWPTLVPLSPLKAGYEDTRRSHFDIDTSVHNQKVNYIRLNMGPDGGIARLKTYGVVKPDVASIPADREIDLVSVEMGGLAIDCSNQHFGHPRNLLAPGRGECMGDGWETARQPLRPACYKRQADGLMLLPGQDWALIKCGLRGTVRRLEIDTHFFKGNYPESCLIEGCLLPPCAESEEKAALESVEWKPILARTRLGPDAIHHFSVENQSGMSDIGVISHLRLTILPDGGIMRVRAFGLKEQQHSRL
mmetsp:Transcript_14990/g.24815  ORF Transcript_14990/g.24815 Transcript_14990/m.24815 type:complete len:399 (+) Transcript_14990:45-1241(+)